MGSFFSPSVKEYNAPFLKEAQQYFGNLQPTNVGSLDSPDMPYSEKAAADMARSVDRYGPEMQKFFYGMMQGGGMQDIDSILANMSRMGDIDRDKTIAGIKASGMPMASSGMGRAMTSALTEADLARQLAMGEFSMGAQERAMERMFSGAGGLAGMPGYYGQPSSVEQAMMGIKAPYDLTSYQSQVQSKMQRDQMMANWMAQLGMYQPERIQQASPFERFVMPLVQGGISAYALSKIFGTPSTAPAIPAIPAIPDDE